ncbi:MAG: precorrin-2 dehydrogenase/sirohydrochlorin ferrochelatase family protein [Bdellovibrionales bacterium]
MFPIILNPAYTKFALIGNGPLADKRMAGLQDAGVTLTHFKDKPPRKRELKKFHIVYIVDIDDKTAYKLADYCRRKNILVNIEDDIPYCDFHTPSIVRRGNLLFSVSTNGKSPGLGIRIKNYISDKFGPEWGERLEILAQKRHKWRSQGLDNKTVLKNTLDEIDKNNWL